MNKSKTFCVAPWVHAHVSANGNRRICCVTLDEAPGEFAKLPWSEFKNSDYMKKIRLKMINGELPKECEVCDYSNRTISTRDVLNEFYESKIDELIKNTGPDGSTDAPLNYLDYRSNLCNLRCRTCGPASSSRYQEFINTSDPEISEVLFPGEVGKDAKAMASDFTNRNLPEFMNLIETQPIDRIYFAGGEPVIEPGHFKVLDSFINRDKAKDVILFYNSNVSFNIEIVKKWVDKLTQFKEALIQASVDGIGDICEYIRDGSSFANIDRNLKYIQNNKNERVQVFLDITLTSLNFFFLKEYAKYAIDNKFQIFCKLMTGSDNSAPILRIESIEIDLRQRVIDRWKNYYISLNADEKKLIENLNQLLNMLADRQDPCIESFADSVMRMNLLERMHPDKPKLVDLLKRDELGDIFSKKIIFESVKNEVKT